MRKLLVLEFRPILFFSKHFLIRFTIEFSTEYLRRPASILLYHQRTSKFFLELRWIAILKKACHYISLYKDNFPFGILLQEFLSDWPEEATCAWWSQNVGDVHSGSESWLQKWNGAFHGAHHRHYPFVSNIYQSIPHFDLTRNEHVPDDELEKVNFALVNLLLRQVEFYHFLDI